MLKNTRFHTLIFSLLFSVGILLFSILFITTILLTSFFLLRPTVINSLIYSQPQNQDLSQLSGKEEQEKYWENRIKGAGGKQAYGEFKQAYLSDYPNNIHYIAHIFGTALYKTEGTKGMTHCDSNFAYGCYHGFILKALSESGDSIVSKLNQTCIENIRRDETGCRHGIGHGLLEYFGHNNLEKALKLCASIQNVTPLGCTQGVFMGYNRPMSDNENKFLEVRSLDQESEIYKPCEDLPDEFQISCYYEQSQWWTKLFSQNYSKVGNLCESLKKSRTQIACYLGVGVIAGQTTGFNVEKTIENCTKMPNMLSNIYCRSGAGWVFKANPNYKKQAALLCEGLKETDEEFCIKNSISPDQILP